MAVRWHSPPTAWPFSATSPQPIEAIPAPSPSANSLHWASHTLSLRVPKPRAKSSVGSVPFGTECSLCLPSSESIAMALLRSSWTTRSSSKTTQFAVPQGFPQTMPGTRHRREPQLDATMPRSQPSEPLLGPPLLSTPQCRSPSRLPGPQLAHRGYSAPHRGNHPPSGSPI